MEEVSGRGGGGGWAPRLRLKERERWGGAGSESYRPVISAVYPVSHPASWLDKAKSVGAKSPLRVVEQRGRSFSGFELKPQRRGPWKARRGSCSGPAQKQMPRGDGTEKTRRTASPPGPGWRRGALRAPPGRPGSAPRTAWCLPIRLPAANFRFLHHKCGL